MERRFFIKMCATAVATICAKPGILLANSANVQNHNRVLITTNTGKPLVASSLPTTDAYVFHYPYVSTPCFLINLGKRVNSRTIGKNNNIENSEEYHWNGGVGEQQSIVAFSAICTHQLSYPKKQISFISFNSDKTKISQQEQSIVCCAHQNVFDPGQGGVSIAGESKIPLTAIILDYDKVARQLYAVGTLGHDIYSDFFRVYKKELNEEFGRGGAKKKVEDKIIAQLHSEYSAQVTRC